MTEKAFTGWKRNRKTRWSVRAGEVTSRFVITVGGIGTIVSVAMIMVFLVSVVLPLFRDAQVDAAGKVTLGSSEGETGGSDVLRLSVDEYRILAAVVLADGTLRVHRLDDGSVLEERPLFDGEPPLSSAFSVDGQEAGFGFADGTVRLATLRFEPEFLERGLAPELDALEPGKLAVYGGGLVQRTPEGQLRQQTFRVELKDPIEIADGDPVVLLDRSTLGNATSLAVLSESGALRVFDLSERKNLLTGKITYRKQSSELPFDPAGRGTPNRLLLSGLGDLVYVSWADGATMRIDARDRENPALAETVDLVPEQGERLTTLDFLLGKSTLVAGDTLGRIRCWFTIKPEGAGTVDGSLLVLAHDLAPGGAPVTAVSPSSRTRILSVGYADGALKLFQVTNQRTLAELVVEGGAPVENLILFPKQDGLACLAGGRLHRFELEASHPEGGMTALFAPVWYEGYEKPQHVWQSSSGTDDFEPKLGLVPLIFGTLKATFYSMLFGAPLAILAAIYTSEFLNRRLRTPVKSTIEIMASLPSVVLGFLAALVIAPQVQRYLPATLAVFLTLPFALLAGAYVWQLLPRRFSLRWGGWPRLFCIAAALIISIFLAAVVGPMVERAFFGGNLELWLDGQAGSAVGGWMFLCLPLAVLLVALAMGTFVTPWMRVKSSNWSHGTSAGADFAKFLLGGVATVGVALLLSGGLDLAGLDPRQDLFGFLGTYVQRNALVVGFVMGFAVIPIIYTLAEDALSSVPEHLRLASLGAGATPWQTAIRIVVPTAMSGLFSAIMIGLGRAVGETMIVLMATGNTPVMDLNVFNGFRTLSANIAVELPEAVQHSTHYRTLFLAALVLFAMTFVLNTLAEVVRQRFRKRFHQL